MMVLQLLLVVKGIYALRYRIESVIYTYSYFVGLRGPRLKEIIRFVGRNFILL